MTDTLINLTAGAAGVSGNVPVTASSNLFTADDVGRGLTIRCQCPVRQASTAYATGQVFYSEYNSVDRVYRVTGAGTTAAFDGAGTTPNFDLNAPRATTDDIVDGTCLLKYLGPGQLAYGFGTIVGYAGPTAVVVDVDPRGPFASTTFSLHWALGDWSNLRGWPAAVTFWQQRTVWGGAASKPDTLYFSQSGDFENMAAYEPDGTVLDTDAIILGLDDDQVNTVRWLIGIPRGLAVGVASGEFLVGPASTVNAAISPSNVRGVRQGDRGSPGIAGVRVGGVVLFVQRGGQKLRELQYDFATDSFTTADLTQLSDHISGPGWVEIAYQEEPDGTMWLVRSDGLLVSLTYDREQRVRAWAKHAIGGTGAVVESVCCVPSPDGTGDDLYVAVARTVGGQTLRTIEYIRRPFRADLDGANGGFFVDGGLTYAGAPATVFTGLDYLEGETMAICADGAVRPSQVVLHGRVTIDGPGASLVHIGLPYSSVLQTLPPEVPAGGSIQGKLKEIHQVAMRFLETRGGAFGNAVHMEALQFRGKSTAMSQAYPLFTGEKVVQFPGGTDRLAQMTIRQDQPLPLTLLSVTYDLATNA